MILSLEAIYYDTGTANVNVTLFDISFIKFSNRVDVVAEGFIQLLNDEDKVGEAMRISVQNGIDYHTFSEQNIPL
jgi:hypothetical protein